MNQKVKHIIVKQGQSIFDVALQEFGTLEAVVCIVKDNCQVESLSAFIQPGTVLRIRRAIIEEDGALEPGVMEL